MELTALSERVQVVRGPVNIGVLRLRENRVALIDSGVDAHHAGRLLRLLTDVGYVPAYILVTHAHADHIGGNAMLQEACGCRILAPPREVPAVQYPLVQAIATFGGAPLPELENRFLVAPPSVAEPLPANRFALDDLDLEVLALPGHSLDQVGYLVDGVAFVADTLFSERFFRKNKVVFLYDPVQHLHTLKSMRELVATWYVPSHVEPRQKIDLLIEQNRFQVEQALTVMTGLLAIPQPMDRLIRDFLKHFGLSKTGWEHFLQRAIVHSHLSALKRLGRADFKVMDNLLMWFAKQPESRQV
jgi:glyoxylase-like metal-dependent hydrolase (beta-lactamase superfamily II)